MTALYLYDDATARSFEPFTLTRPVSELRAGIGIIRQRWERTTGLSAVGFASAPWLADFEENGAPTALAPDAILPAGSLVASSRCVIGYTEVLATRDRIWECDGRVAAVRLAHDVRADALADGTLALESLAPSGKSCTIAGRWLEAPWDLIAQLSAQLNEDIPAVSSMMRTASLMYDSLGSFTLTVEEGATVEPYVLFDASAGPVLIRRGATISAFTRLVGPCYVGHDAIIAGDRVANCAIGAKSKVRGEFSSSIVLGHSNKGHTGFVGHSYLGRWVNLGSGTTTSNLKNTYGPVQMWTPSGQRDTGQQFLGTLFGDHAKTGIGTMLTTGTVIGAGANVFGGEMPPKYVPPFAWGHDEPHRPFAADKFLAVVERMMQRRGMQLGDHMRRQLLRAHAERAPRA